MTLNMHLILFLKLRKSFDLEFLISKITEAFSTPSNGKSSTMDKSPKRLLKTMDAALNFSKKKTKSSILK